MKLMQIVVFLLFFDPISAQTFTPPKSTGISTLSIYQTGEDGIRIHADMPEQVLVYENGRLRSTTRYKYDWNKRKGQFLSSDSSIYDQQGRVIKYITIGDVFRQPGSETVSEYDAKGRLAKEEYFYYENGVRAKQNYNVYSYNAAGKLEKLRHVYPDPVLCSESIYSYNSKGQLAKEIFFSSGDKKSGISTAYTYDNNDRLISAVKTQEGTAPRKEISAYDAKGRLISKTTTSGDAFVSEEKYYYLGENTNYYGKYTRYPGMSDLKIEQKNDMRHEYMEYDLGGAGGDNSFHVTSLGRADITLLSVYGDTLLRPQMTITAEIARTLMEDIRVTGEAMKTQLPETNKPIPTGRYLGQPLFEHMTNITMADLDLFLNYLLVRPKIYAGKAWKLSEVYATWAQRGGAVAFPNN